MAEYWLISAPGEKTCQQTWDTLNRATAQNQLSINYKFNVPDLKVGTLDMLVGMSDDLGKLDVFVEGIARKVAGYLGEVLEEQRDKLQENLLANGMDLNTYMTRFQWDMAKYPIKQSLKNISDIISKQVSQIDADLKNKASAYNNLKGSLQNLERKQAGSLLTRSLWDVVKKEDFVLDSDFMSTLCVVVSKGSLLTRSLADIVQKTDFVLESEYLTTIVVVVPKGFVNDWKLKYETLTDMVVPRSSKLIIEDDEYAIFTVTLFKRVVDEYKHHCREHKFIVRDFVYDEEQLLAGKNEINKLTADKKKQFGPLVRWLKVNFSEAFTAWIHVKALRVFVESVLRYGLPVNFQAVLLRPYKKQQRRLREVLDQLYTHLDNTAYTSGADVDIPGLSLVQGDYYAYVYYKIDIDMLDSTGR